MTWSMSWSCWTCSNKKGEKSPPPTWLWNGPARYPLAGRRNGLRWRICGPRILPPESASFRNPYSDWIGAQMRGMIVECLPRGNPMEAARLAFTDASISHCANGVYGELYSAVLVALAFSKKRSARTGAPGAGLASAKKRILRGGGGMPECACCRTRLPPGHGRCWISASRNTTGSMLILTWLPTCWRFGTGRGYHRIIRELLAYAGMTWTATQVRGQYPGGHHSCTAEMVRTVERPSGD